METITNVIKCPHNEQRRGDIIPAYKDEKRGSWYCQFYYDDWTGKRKLKKKRGFAKKGDAKRWEYEFLNSLKTNPEITFGNLVKNYLDDMGTRLKPTTLETKRSLIETKILPFFAKMKLCDIDELCVRKWQNELLAYQNKKGEPYSDTYLKTIHNQLSATLNYATAFYGLSHNPCHRVGSIGKAEADAMQIWTLDQYEQFIAYEKKSAGHLAFNILFWTGIREGELLALTKNDFILNCDEYLLNIEKNFQIVKGTKYILTTKTDEKRCINIPEFLYRETMNYYETLYEAEPEERLFYFTKSYLLNEIKRVAKLSKLEPIRVHDLRHSHASLLIEMGFNILMISKRLGHERVETTWQTYAHLYPDKHKLLATQLNAAKINGITSTLTLEDQLSNFINQFQKHIETEPNTINLCDEEIIRWDIVKKERTIANQDDVLAEVSDNMESELAIAKIIQDGYIETNGIVFCLSSRGMPVKYL
jgi:integrase